GAPVSRQGRGRPAPRRTPPARAGGPRRGTPPRRPAPRRERPAPPPPEPQYDEWPYEGERYEGEPYGAEPYGGVPYEDPRYGDGHEAASPSGPRGGKPKRPGKAKRPQKAAKAKQAGGAKRAGKAKQAGRSGGLGPRLYFGAAAVLGAFLLLGAAGVVLLRGGNGPAPEHAADAKIGTPAGNGPSPVSYSSSPSTSAYGGIASRSADPGPLTIGEVFPAEAATLSVPGGKAKVRLRAKRLDGDCAAAVWGGSVGAELGRGGCTQAARGIYSDPRHGYALAVAVFNLNAAADADRFVERLEHTIGAGFVLPLEAPRPLDGFGRGFGMARGLAMGHFAVVSWAQRLDGKGDETDETLLSLLIEGGKSPAVLGRAARASD
ncbi:hypothetical protein, partial [Actinomadura monticuli]